MIEWKCNENVCKNGGWQMRSTTQRQTGGGRTQRWTVPIWCVLAVVLALVNVHMLCRLCVLYACLRVLLV
jgi:hypothetical protein